MVHASVKLLIRVSRGEEGTVSFITRFLLFLGKGRFRTIDAVKRREQNHLSSLSLSLYFYPFYSLLSHSFVPAKIVPVSSSSWTRAQGCRVLVSYRNRGSIYTIPVFLPYLRTHRRCSLVHERPGASLWGNRERQLSVWLDGKGGRDLHARVTERDRRVSLVGLATINGEEGF